MPVDELERLKLAMAAARGCGGDVGAGGARGHSRQCGSESAPRTYLQLHVASCCRCIQPSDNRFCLLNHIIETAKNEPSLCGRHGSLHRSGPVANTRCLGLSDTPEAAAPSITFCFSFACLRPRGPASCDVSLASTAALRPGRSECRRLACEGLAICSISAYAQHHPGTRAGRLSYHQQLVV